MSAKNRIYALIISGVFFSLPASACENYQGYAKGKWLKATAFVYVSASLCKEKDALSEITWHWNKGTVRSKLSGFGASGNITLKEPRKKENGSIQLKRNQGFLQGVFSYYAKEYPDFSIYLMPTQHKVNLFALDKASFNQALVASAKKNILDPVLVLSAIQDTSDTPEPEISLKVKQISKTKMRIELTHEHLGDDSINGIKKIFGLKRNNKHWVVESEARLLSCGRGGDKSYQQKGCP